MTLFGTNSGANFSECRRYRYALWRIWDDANPPVMFIGLNPSTANEATNDPTIRRVIHFAKAWGHGGVYMLNCFPFVSTDPEKLRDYGNTAENDHWLYQCARKSSRIVFAWGAFRVVRDLGRDIELKGMFPEAQALVINADGTPRHPLYVKGDTIPVRFH